MRTGSTHQAGSDSLLTAATYFKMREIYFNDSMDDSEYNGKLYGLGSTFPTTNGLAEPGRGGATLAEREDRGSFRDAQNHTSVSASQNMGMALGGSSLPTSSSYGPMAANGAYMRTTMVGGGR